MFKKYIVLFVVLGLAGFQSAHSQSSDLKPMSTIEGAKVVEFSSSIPDAKIRLEYKQDKLRRVNRDLFTKFEGRNPIYKIIEGNGDLVKLIKLGIWPLPDTEPKETPIETQIDSSIANDRYDIYLKYPAKESREKVLDFIGSELGFRYTISETQTDAFKATWNGKTISFPSTARQSGLRQMQTYKITNLSMSEIFGIYNTKYKVVIDDRTGISDRFDGFVILPPSFDEVKQDLQDNSGIRLESTTLRTKKLELQAR